MASYILSGEHEIDSDKKLEPLDPIFHAIRSSAIISNEALDITKEQMERFKTTYKNDAKATSILEKASYALGFAKSLSNIAKDSADIKLGEILRNFRKESLRSYMSMVRNIMIMQGLCFVCFVLFCALTFYQARIVIKQLKQIKLLKATVDTAHSSVVFCDNSNKILYVNKTFEVKTGYKLSEVVGKDPKILKSYMHPDSFYAEIKNAIMNKSSWESDELISKTKSGNLLYEKVRFAPFFFEEKLEGCMAV